jgi:hypothetical protein
MGDQVQILEVVEILHQQVLLKAIMEAILLPLVQQIPWWWRRWSWCCRCSNASPGPGGIPGGGYIDNNFIGTTAPVMEKLVKFNNIFCRGWWRW